MSVWQSTLQVVFCSPNPSEFLNEKSDNKFFSEKWDYFPLFVFWLLHTMCKMLSTP